MPLFTLSINSKLEYLRKKIAKIANPIARMAMERNGKLQKLWR